MRFLLDTNAVLYLLGGRLATPLESGSYAVSVISEMELLSYSNLTADEECQIRAFLANVVMVELTKDVRTAAIELRRRHGLKLPDAIIAASAQITESQLLTNDLQLLKIADVNSSELILRKP